MIRKLAILLAPDSSAGGAAVAPPPPSSSPPNAAAAGTPTPPAVSSTINKPDADADIFSELHGMDTPPAPEPKAKPDPAAPKPDAKPAPDKPAEPAPDAALNTPKGLREHAKRIETENKTLKGSISEMERKIAAAEEAGKSTTKLTERLADLEKQLQERDAKIYAANVAESPEFKEKFVKPYQEAAEFAKEQVGLMEVATVDPETQEVTNVRKADFNSDFVPVYNLAKTSLTRAHQMAKQLFGDSATMVMNHVAEIQRLDRAQGLALRDMQAKAVENKQTEIAQSAQQREWIQKAWRDVNTDLAEKEPEIFQPDPKDKQRADLFTKSLQLVDARHNGRSLTPIQQVTLDAQVRLRAAAFPVLKYDNAKLKARIAELEGEKSDEADGKPGGTQRAASDSGNKPAKPSFGEELNSMT